MAILIIEDEKNMSDLLKLELTHSGYQCDQAFDGEKGLLMALKNDYELILLDLMLPRINGIELCRRLREVKQTPVIMLTARDEVMDKVNGLQVGADDYLAKPFAMEELLARISALLRRINIQKAELEYSYSDIRIDTSKRKVYFKDKEIVLTATEFDLLTLLVKNGGNVVRRDMILDEVWGYDDEVSTNVVEVYIRYLRNKIAGIKIETVRGVGYRLS
ncbi:DNA-binding response regulator [Thomasclavelia cocleata]|uniref:DNA-binding response regulator, OmpR family, contains REC and winged-helix (WHTH) domain n=1 Tax=Thomasclavelia cocleata TaxID=69824 RepID=A0A1I0E3E8_9FIRM|nr:response regulator transcription factor [Thomasclavelia cocleata]NDO42783.1 response regulator transcription factor [Thomasclavelia cocleata]PJN80732.1 DNA-binding response regulator [Thomasclavelia cocleata]SET38871.1 DNA-binding response regulator, OmpR family, contains REC and winged-helix (wHTH) domain [Thomasclavelia cocleata]